MTSTTKRLVLCSVLSGQNSATFEGDYMQLNRLSLICRQNHCDCHRRAITTNKIADILLIILIG